MATVRQSVGKDATGGAFGPTWSETTLAGSLLLAITSGDGASPTAIPTGYTLLKTIGGTTVFPQSASFGGNVFNVYAYPSAPASSGAVSFTYAASTFPGCDILEITGMPSMAYLDVTEQNGIVTTTTSGNFTVDALGPTLHPDIAILVVTAGDSVSTSVLSGGGYTNLVNSGTNAALMVAWQDGLTPGETLNSSNFTCTFSNSTGNAYADAFQFTIVERLPYKSFIIPQALQASAGW